MIRVLYKKLEKYTSTGLILTGLVLVALFNAIIFPGFPKLFGITIPVEQILDIKFSYSPQEVYGFFEGLGEKGREVYRLSEMLVDLSYMIMYTFLYSILTVRLLKINQILSKHWLIGFPLLLGFFDLLENTGIIILLSEYPKQINWLVNITSVFTSLKWIFALFTFISIISLIFLWVYKKWLKN